ncbi:MAG: DUF721 domain-containing protein [Nitrospinales bacterium]
MRDTFKAKKNWTGLKDILLHSIKSIDFKSSDTLSWLSFQWQLIVGKELSAISQVHSFRSQTLYVRLAGLEWAPALETLKPKIIREINDQADNKTLLKKIIFKKGDVFEIKEARRFAPNKKKTELYVTSTGMSSKKDNV